MVLLMQIEKSSEVCEKAEKVDDKGTSLECTSVHDSGGEWRRYALWLLKKSSIQVHSELPSPRLLGF